MHTLSEPEELRLLLKDLRRAGETIGFVPTMGNLHAGHLSLVETAIASCTFCVASIFVNPMQFGENEDLESYPRSLEQDSDALNDLGCHCLFLPSESSLYPEGTKSHTRIQVPSLAEMYCGEHRPGHFDGVTTVVAMLLNIVQPDSAFFGLKDFQQFLLIKKMVNDLRMEVSLKGVETVRESSGLAMSSRNNYLDTAQRKQAAQLYATLQDAAEKIRSGELDFARLEKEALDTLEDAGFRPDYFAICEQSNLATAGLETSDFAIIAAAHLGDTRLIDNVRFSL